MEQEFIVIGSIIAPWGKNGQLKVKVLTDFPQRFQSGATVYLDNSELVIQDARKYKDGLIVKLQNIDSIEDAERLSGKTLCILRQDATLLPEGQYYYFQLIGMEVWTTTQKNLGEITGVQVAAGNDIYIVNTASGKELLIPAVEDVVKSIDLAQKKVIIEPIKGLLELNETKE